MDELTREKWQRLRSVFAEAIEAPPSQRSSRLDELCVGDPGLRADVEALLDAEAEAGALLESAVEVAAGALVAELGSGEPEQNATDALAGARVGAYELVREIARGGMGTVYLAERADGEFEQRVAVKLLRPGAEGADAERRFRAERQILAELEHPNIARLLDGGITEGGRPFLVMEYVDGVPINKYCDQHALDIEQRFSLFRSVCNAVQHAHRNLIVHRDLKPANILVSGDGQVKMLDFGIAKLLGPERPDLALPETRVGHRWLTPEYASPEQVRGEPVTTLTDVYQLGVVLYELVAGRRPFARASTSVREIERAVIDDEPDRPSTAPGRTTEGRGERSHRERRARRRLSADVDAIVLKALRKQPELRYASADALADDIRRCLDGLPVHARGGERMYRATRFLRRHRTGMAVAAAFVLLLAGYAATVTVQRARIQAALDRAQIEAAKSEQVAEFLIGLFETADPDEAWGLNVTGGELLDRGVRRAEVLAAQPEVKTRLLEVIARTYQRLAAPTSARQLFERVLVLRREAFGEDHLEVATTLHDLGTQLRIMGEYTEAESLLMQSAEIRRRLLGPEHEDLAASLFALGMLHWNRGHHETAETLIREALGTRRKLLGDVHRQTAYTLSRLGLLLWERGDPIGAESAIAEALATHRTLLGDDHIFVANDLNNLGLTLLDRGRPGEAERLFGQALDIERRRLGDDDALGVRKLSNLAVALREQEKYEEADSVLRRALAIARSAREGGGVHHTGGRSRERDQDLALVLVHLGQLELRRADAAAAEQLLRESVDIHERISPPGDWRTADAKGWLGECLTALGRYEEAEPLALAAFSGLRSHWGPEHPRTLAAHSRLEQLYAAWGNPVHLPADPP